MSRPSQAQSVEEGGQYYHVRYRDSDRTDAERVANRILAKIES